MNPSTSTPPAYTPKPWTVQVYRNINGYPVYQLKGVEETPAEAKGNRVLMEATLDLLDACRLAAISMKEALDGNSPAWMDNMRADLSFIEKAIEKALPHT